MEFPLQDPNDPDGKKSAARQRQSVRLIAEKIENGDELNLLERSWIAAILRGSVESIQPSHASPGRPSKIPVGDVVMEVALLVCFQSKSKTAAIQEIAEKYGVTSENIRQHFKERGAEALAFINSTK